MIGWIAYEPNDKFRIKSQRKRCLAESLVVYHDVEPGGGMIIVGWDVCQHAHEAVSGGLLCAANANRHSASANANLLFILLLMMYWLVDMSDKNGLS